MLGIPTGMDLGFSYGAALGGLVACVVVAVIAAIVVYFLFMTPKNERKFTGFTDWLYQFCNFKKLVLEVILKVAYIATAIFLFFYFIWELAVGYNFFGALLTFVLGEIVARIMSELTLLLIVICRNTTEINKKLSGGAVAISAEAAPADAAPQTPPPPPTCSKCGTLINGVDKFCAVCGNKLK